MQLSLSSCCLFSGSLESISLWPRNQGRDPERRLGCSALTKPPALGHLPASWLHGICPGPIHVKSTQGLGWGSLCTPTPAPASVVVRPARYGNLTLPTCSWHGLGVSGSAGHFPACSCPPKSPRAELPAWGRTLCFTGQALSPSLHWPSLSVGPAAAGEWIWSFASPWWAWEHLLLPRASGLLGSQPGWGSGYLCTFQNIFLGLLAMCGQGLQMERGTEMMDDCGGQSLCTCRPIALLGVGQHLVSPRQSEGCGTLGTAVVWVGRPWGEVSACSGASPARLASCPVHWRCGEPG